MKFKMKPQRVWELTRKNQIPSVKLGTRQYRYSEAAIQAFIDRGGNQNNKKAK